MPIANPNYRNPYATAAAVDRAIAIARRQGYRIPSAIETMLRGCGWHEVEPLRFETVKAIAIDVAISPELWGLV